MASSGTTIGPATEPLKRLVRAFLERYPLAGPADIYRLIRDGAMGPGGEPDERATAARLTAEAASAPTNAPLLEDTDISGVIVRVNLGPYVARGGDLNALAAAVVESGRRHHPRRDQLFTFWSGFVHMNRRREFQIDRDELERFEMSVASAGYPPVEPSPAFRDAYQPRYAVVLRELVPLLPEP